jgi:hypothetical protein
MVIRDDGYIALQHYTSNGISVRIAADNITYTFVPQHNVSLAWVKPQHVPELLREKARICCGKQKNRFDYASEINVNLWLYDDRHSRE